MHRYFIKTLRKLAYATALIWLGFVFGSLQLPSTKEEFGYLLGYYAGWNEVCQWDLVADEAIENRADSYAIGYYEGAIDVVAKDCR